MSTKISKEDERVIFSLNDHWIVIVKPVFVLIIGWFSFYGIHQLTILLKNISTELSYIVLFINFWFLVILHHWFFLMIIRWRISDWYVTNRKIIDFQNKPFIKNDSKFIKISEIHEIEMKKRGLVANILDYGHVIINVAAVPEPMILENLPEPSKFLHIIEDIRTKSRYREINVDSLQKAYGRRYKFIAQDED